MPPTTSSTISRPSLPPPVLVHAAARLALELARLEHRHLRQGRTRLHVETYRAIHLLMGLFLHLTGLWNRGCRNAATPRVVNHRLALHGLPPAFAGYRILHLSDLHIDGAPGLPDTLARLLPELPCDLCVITGDFSYEHGPVTPAGRAALERVVPTICARDGVLAVLGNHDFADVGSVLAGLGVQLLCNSGMAIRRGADTLWVGGVDDPHYYCLDDLPAALVGAPAESFKLLLAHSPEIWQSAADAGVGLYLCGHTHGGQICLPGRHMVVTNAKSPRRLARGLWHAGNMLGCTSAGIGASCLPVRFNCPGEVLMLDLRAASLPALAQLASRANLIVKTTLD